VSDGEDSKVPPIYDRSTRELLGDAAAELTPPFSVEDVTAWFEARYPKLKRSNVTAQIRFLTANDPNRQHHAYRGGQEPILFRTEVGFVPYDQATHGEWNELGQRVSDALNPLDGFTPPVPYNGDEVRVAPEGPGVHVVFDDEGRVAFVGQTDFTKQRLQDHLSGGRRSALRRAVGGVLDSSLSRTAENQEITDWLNGCTVSWLEADSVQTAGLKGRLIKDLKPRFNTILPEASAKVWWVNQGRSYDLERTAGVIFAPSSTGLPHHDNVASVQPGDVVLHYTRGRIEAVSVVTEPGREMLRPYEAPDMERDVGYSATVDYRPLDEPIAVEEIQPRTPTDGVFDVNGSVKQQYLMPLPPAFAARLAREFANRWPEGSLDATKVPGGIEEREDLAGLVARWRAETGYPTARDEKFRGQRLELAPSFSPEGLQGMAADLEFARSILNRFAASAYGSPGPQPEFNRQIQDADMLRLVFANIDHVLYGGGDVADRIDEVLTVPERMVRGFKEALITKALAIAHPDQWFPSFVSAGAKGKVKLIQRLGLSAPSASATVGQRATQSNNTLDVALDPLIGDDPWGKQAFCFWLSKHEITSVPPVEVSDVVTLAGLADRLYVPEAFLTRTIRLLDDRHQVVFYGPPGTGKTYVARQLADHVAGTGEVVKVQFHPSYAYEDFVEGYRPRLKDGVATFELVDGPLKQLALIAEDRPDENHVLLIDEINRGNVAKILGELFFLLEYRDEEMRLQYSAEPFRLPENLLIIATMNTADRSIALVDAALRRRFHFVPFFPNRPPVQGLLRRWLTDHRPSMVWVADLVDRANEMLDDRHLAIGPSHFLRADLDDEWLDLVWEHSVLPYLAEQFFGDEGRLVPFELARLRRALAADPSASGATTEGEGNLADLGAEDAVDDSDGMSDSI
jgi:MoxR-like ATPase